MSSWFSLLLAADLGRALVKHGLQQDGHLGLALKRAEVGGAQHLHRVDEPAARRLGQQRELHTRRIAAQAAALRARVDVRRRGVEAFGGGRRGARCRASVGR